MPIEKNKKATLRSSTSEFFTYIAAIGGDSVIKEYLTTAADRKKYTLIQDQLFVSDFDRVVKQIGGF